MALSYQDYELARQKEFLATKSALMPVLRDNGIKYVAIDYTGYGDSGQIDTIAVYGKEATSLPDTAYDDTGRMDMPDVVVTLPEETGKKLADVLDQFGWDAAYVSFPGFETNEGGQGTVLIDVEADKVIVNHGFNIIQVEHDSREYE
jgi:hypothetical protein